MENRWKREGKGNLNWRKQNKKNNEMRVKEEGFQK